jgi:NAD(P)-dependent dehydrogenase (short-subunit alcohol dehydrogenase family)
MAPSPAFDLNDAVAVVTGAAGGIGRQIAVEFADAGADVVVGDVRREPRVDGPPTHEFISEAGGSADFVETDVSDAADARALVDHAVDTFGGLDVLVNNAGLPRAGALHEMDESDWRAVIDVNLTGVFQCSRFAMPVIREGSGGRIVNMASTLGLVGKPGGAAYCASKGGIVNLTRQMAIEYAPDGVTVNAICPGVIDAGMAGERLADDDYREQVSGQTPLPYLGTATDVARAARFLASDAGRFVTGHALVVDGGWTAQ